MCLNGHHTVSAGPTFARITVSNGVRKRSSLPNECFVVFVSTSDDKIHWFWQRGEYAPGPGVVDAIFHAFFLKMQTVNVVLARFLYLLFMFGVFAY